MFWPAPIVLACVGCILLALLARIPRRSRARAALAAAGLALACSAWLLARRPAPPPAPAALPIREIKRAVADLASGRRAVGLSGQLMHALGEVFHYGRFEHAVDRQRALAHYRQAAQAGHTAAHCSIGLALLEEGATLAAAAEFLRAAEAGHAEGLLHLGRVFEHGANPDFHSNRVMAKEVYEAAARTADPAVVHEAELRLLQMQARTEDELYPGARPIPLDPLPAIRRIGLGRRQPQQQPPQQQPPGGGGGGGGIGGARAAGIFAAPWDQGRDMGAEAIIFNQTPQRVWADSQNVHSTTALTCVAAFVQKLAPATTATYQDAARGIRRYIAEKGVGNLDDVTRVLNSLTASTHSRLGVSEQDLLARVWQRIQASDEGTKDALIHNLVLNVGEAVERGAVVCSTGKAMRIAAAFDGVDVPTGDSLTIKPDWAVDEELGTAAAMVRESVLASATGAERDAYEKSDPTDQEAETASGLADRMVALLRAKAKADYVDPGIATRESVDNRLEPLVEALR